MTVCVVAAVMNLAVSSHIRVCLSECECVCVSLLTAIILQLFEKKKKRKMPPFCSSL